MTRTFAILSVLALATPAYADFSITPNEMDATVSTDAGPALPNPQVAAPRPKHHHAIPLTSRVRDTRSQGRWLRFGLWQASPPRLRYSSSGPRRLRDHLGTARRPRCFR